MRLKFATIAKWKGRLGNRSTLDPWRRREASSRAFGPGRMEARIPQRGAQAAHGVTQCQTRTTGNPLRVLHTLVERVWQRAGLQPHGLERYVRLTDPMLEEKAADTRSARVVRNELHRTEFVFQTKSRQAYESESALVDVVRYFTRPFDLEATQGIRAGADVFGEAVAKIVARRNLAAHKTVRADHLGKLKRVIAVAEDLRPKSQLR